MFISRILDHARRSKTWFNALLVLLALCSTAFVTHVAQPAEPVTAPTTAPSPSPSPSTSPTSEPKPTPEPSVSPAPEAPAPQPKATATPIVPPPAVETPAPPAPAESAPPAESASPEAPSGDAALAAEVVRLVNVERANAGCSAVTALAVLGQVARAHSQDMADKAYFDHISLDGRSPWDRLEAAGYSDGSGENIAAGQQTAQDVMNVWMNSSGHRANILNCESKTIGVGIGHGGPYGIYWTQVFGRS